MSRLILLIHRYLGIAISLLFLLWFASGFVIIYTGGMPALSEAQRLDRLPDLDVEALATGPGEAAAIIGSSATPTLTTVMGRPAYRFSGRAGGVVFADTGQRLDRSILSSQQIVAEFTGAAPGSIARVGRIDEVDQWTIGLRGQLPLEKFAVADGVGSEVYVSPSWGQVVLHTTRRDRLLAWLGAIPHWLYFVQLRRDAALWTQVVVWLSGLGTVLTLLGMVMIVTQLRKTRPFRLLSAIPYRGLMRWHYLSGLVFGLFTLTWVFSGMLSMEPWAWTRPSGMAIARESYQGGPVDLSRYDDMGQILVSWRTANGNAPLKEATFHRFGGSHFLRLTHSDESSHWGFARSVIDPGSSGAAPVLLEPARVAERFAVSAGDNPVIAAELLLNYDNYYYSRRDPEAPDAPLPVIRVKLQDPQQTWFYADATSGEILRRSSYWGRWDRWLYNGLHSLDFGAFYRQRPLWDGIVILLLGGGLLLVLLGSIQGFRRLDRNSRVLVKRARKRLFEPNARG